MLISTANLLLAIEAGCSIAPLIPARLSFRKGRKSCEKECMALPAISRITINELLTIFLMGKGFFIASKDHFPG
jgi:hypothetical protein